MVVRVEMHKIFVDRTQGTGENRRATAAPLADQCRIVPPRLVSFRDPQHHSLRRHLHPCGRTQTRLAEDADYKTLPFLENNNEYWAARRTHSRQSPKSNACANPAARTSFAWPAKRMT
jgi:hypothetical protein